MQDLVVVVNLNGSACRMMAQKLRAEHFYCRIVSSACAAEDIQRMGARGIVLAAGGSQCSAWAIRRCRCARRWAAN